MKIIELTQGQVTQISDEDYGLSTFKWCAQYDPNTGGYYAMRKEKGKLILMHREIMNAPDNMEVDHKDFDTLNNQRFNLRICTKAQNRQNRKKRADNKSGYKGVTWHKHDKVWAARITFNKIRKTIGTFKVIEDAARAYDKKAHELFGEFAKTNFD